MIIKIGYVCLLSSAGLSFFVAVWSALNCARITSHKLAMIESLTLLQAFLILTAFVTLVYAYITSDFSLINVALNSEKAESLFYKISGVWGNPEGSMLLWVVIFSLFGAIFALTKSTAKTFKIRVLSTQAWIGSGFYLFILLTSNPFLKFSLKPLNGVGLNPILQDPALAFHPPILYIGYIGLSIAFSFAVAGLWQGEINPVWARQLRPWCLIAWVFLTLGITLGSFWAYYELGWGGWWFWDPVENAALMPWLIATALIHSLGLVEKQNDFKSMTALLAIMGFGFSLIGTFLVRSGVLTSVHSFAVDPARGQFLLLLTGLILGYGLILFLWRGLAMKNQRTGSFLSYKGVLVFNNFMLCILTTTVFLGTIYPLVIEATIGLQLSVGAPYFNSTFIPLSFPLFVIMGLVPHLSKQPNNLKGITRKLQLPFIVTLVSALGIGLLKRGGLISMLGFSTSVWILAGTLTGALKKFREAKGLSFTSSGMFLAHIGIAFVIMGVTIDSFYKLEKSMSLGLGESIEIGDYRLALEKVGYEGKKNYYTEQALIKVFKGQKNVGILKPERRYYPLQKVITTETAIKTQGLSDLYVVLGEFQGHNHWLVRFYWHPLVNLIWLGGGLSALGGLLAFIGRLRKRSKAWGK